MSNPTEGDRAQAVTVWQGLRDDWRDPVSRLAEAFADARAAGRREVMDRLGPIIADAEVAPAGDRGRGRLVTVSPPPTDTDQLTDDREHACHVGCRGGACETCPCCCAGWCVFGLDGLPEDADDFADWLEIAAEHNPLAAALVAAHPDQGQQR